MDIDSKALEAVARAICAEVNPVAFDDLPAIATYLERKTHVDRPLLDQTEALDVARACIEAYEDAKPSGWLEIASAPKDGTWILLTTAGDAAPFVGMWHHGGWDDGDFRSGMSGMTHWQPLSSPPTGESET